MKTIYFFKVLREAHEKGYEGQSGQDGFYEWGLLYQILLFHYGAKECNSLPHGHHLEFLSPFKREFFCLGSQLGQSLNHGSKLEESVGIGKQMYSLQMRKGINRSHSHSLSHKEISLAAFALFVQCCLGPSLFGK